MCAISRFLLGPCLLVVVLLMAGAPGRPDSIPGNLYRGEWPVYKAQRDWEREESERLSWRQPRQSYQQTTVEAVENIADQFIARNAGSPDSLPEYEGPGLTFDAAVGSGAGVYAFAGHLHPSKDHGLVLNLSPSRVWLPYSIGIPGISLEAPYPEPPKPGEAPDPSASAVMVFVRSICRVYGDYRPKRSGTDMPDLMLQVMAHKTFVVGFPQPGPYDRDLRSQVNEAIEKRTSRPDARGTSLVDIYIFAAQALPEEKSYAERAVREIEKILTAPPGTDGKTSRFPRSGDVEPAMKAAWEKRYFLLLGWVQENFMRDNEKALAAYERVYTNYREALGYNDDAMIFSARILARTGKTDEAKRLYQELAQYYPQGKGFWSRDVASEIKRLNSGEKPSPDWPGKAEYSLMTVTR